MKVEIPQDTELVEPLDEGCIWRQTRGTATEVLGTVYSSSEMSSQSERCFPGISGIRGILTPVLEA